MENAEHDPRKPAYKLVIEHENAWFDFWHTHPDWYGEGNKSPELRRTFLRDLVTLFHSILEQSRVLNHPSQVWILIDPQDSASDSVYLHTQNPNRANFPMEFEGVNWGSSRPDLLSGIEGLENCDFGESIFNTEIIYLIRPLLTS
jgi:hypothetical protein